MNELKSNDCEGLSHSTFWLLNRLLSHRLELNYLTQKEIIEVCTNKINLGLFLLDKICRTVPQIYRIFHWNCMYNIYLFNYIFARNQSHKKNLKLWFIFTISKWKCWQNLIDVCCYIFIAYIFHILVTPGFLPNRMSMVGYFLL